MMHLASSPTRLATAPLLALAAVFASGNAGRAIEPLVLSGHTDAATSLAWSPDGKILATGGFDKVVRLWDVDAAKELAVLRQPTFVYAVAWSPDGKSLAVGGGDSGGESALKLWDVATRKETMTLSGHSNAVLAVAWSPDGKSLASAGEDATVRLWDAANGKSITTLQAHTGAVRSVACHPNGRSLASAGEDKTVRIWDATGREMITFKCDYKPLSVAWSPVGKLIAVGGQDDAKKGTLQVLDAMTGQRKIALLGHAAAVYSVAWSPDGKSLASGGGNRTAKVWDAATGRELAALNGFTDTVAAVAWSPDGKMLATASSDKTVRLWPLQQ